MTSMELIAALEDIDEAFIVEGAPAKKRAAFSVVARRWIAVAACLLLSAGIGFGAWRLQETAPIPENSEEESTVTTTTESTTATTQKPTESTTPPTTGTTNWEGVGGVGLETDLYIKNMKFAVIPGGLIQYFLTTFGRDTLNEAIDEVEASIDSDPYAFVGGSTHFWVHRFDIPREKFEEINNKAKETYKDSPERWEEDVFTDEEINDIYTLSTKEFNEKYKAPTAVVVGDLIYNFNWFYKNDIDLWQKQGFTVEQLQTAVANAKATPYFPRGIADAVEKKLNEYIQTVND